MLRTIKFLLAVLLLTSFFVTVSLAQSSASSQTPTDNYVTEKNFKSKVFEVKHRDPGSLVSVLRHLGSGFKGATISASSEFRTLTVRDFPENIATIEEALNRLDTPVAPRPNIELQMHVLIASESDAGRSSTNVPASLKDVITQLRETLNYRHYEVAASVVQRLTETPRSLQGSGSAEVSGANPGVANVLMAYDYYISQVSLVQNAAGGTNVQIGEFTFTTVSDKDRARVQTALNLRDGEKVVVGTAALRSRALVIVLTAKLIK